MKIEISAEFPENYSPFSKALYSSVQRGSQKLSSRGLGINELTWVITYEILCREQSLNNEKNFPTKKAVIHHITPKTFYTSVSPDVSCLNKAYNRTIPS